MQVFVHANALKEGLNKVLSVVDKRNSRPILTHCKIETQGNSLVIVATDLEVSAKLKVSARVARGGGYCINAKNFFEILKEMPNEEIKLEIEENQNILKLSCNNINFSLLIFKTDDFPHLSFNGPDNGIEIQSNILQSMIAKIIHAISSDEVKLLLNGIFLQQVEGKLRSVATDLYRLSMVEYETNSEFNENLSEGIIVPRKGVNELKKLVDSFPQESVQVSVDDSFIYISARNQYFLSIRLVAREYPAFQAVIPKTTSYRMTIGKSSFLTSIRRIKTLASERSNGIRFSVRENYLILSANRPSLGDATEKMQVNYEGEELEICFNAKYLVDVVSVLEEGEIIFEFNSDTAAALIRSENTPQFLGLIMPIKL